MFWTKKTSFTVNERFEGDETVVYTDYGRGLVFKRFFEEEKFRKELSLYEMLKGVDFVPSILGTVSQPEWWGILMSSEGESIPVDDVEDPSVLTFINRSLTILHDRHIHHHDIAARNILERSDGTLVLIDFANGAFDWECRKMEVEDEIICEDEETLDFASPSDPLTDFCSLV
ncbi:hypothetical protein FA15DRAFT_676696 [Coprinopsis marcescibilis]|uniref:Protein kinase domain-containing protein n=1 Tax=Coprinopsis marcescibilis TaxID=230819 RepID=A0A5C3K973_COPMA|nr:hypothetical protein FA15DRAFT_676696 [Coprinopsis marcescibilis]